MSMTKCDRASTINHYTVRGHSSSGSGGGKPPRFLESEQLFKEHTTTLDLTSRTKKIPLFKIPPQGEGSPFNINQNPDDKFLRFRGTFPIPLPQELQHHILSFLSTEQVEYLKDPVNPDYFLSPNITICNFNASLLRDSCPTISSHKPLSILEYANIPNPNYKPIAHIAFETTLSSLKLTYSDFKACTPKEFDLSALQTFVVENSSLQAFVVENKSSNKCVIL